MSDDLEKKVAARIEALEADLKDYQRQVLKLEDELEAQDARIDALEAALREAREKVLQARHSSRNRDRTTTDLLLSAVIIDLDLNRTALAAGETR